ncbi:MAG: class I SAM-dependent methyltransferase [Promethearchaeota archaeon]
MRSKNKKDESFFLSKELNVTRANLRTWNYWGRAWRLGRKNSSPDPHIMRLMKIRALTYRVAYLEMVKLFQGLKNKCVVDIGCGTSHYLGWLANDCKRLVGVDISVEMLKLCREDWGKSIELVAADALYLPFKDDVFDISTTFQALHHFANWEKALTEMTRTAKGVSVYEPNKESFLHRLMHLVRKNLRVEQRFRQTDEDYSLVEFQASGFHQKMLVGFLQKRREMNTKVFMFGIISVCMLEKISTLSTMLLHFVLVVEDLLRKMPILQNQLGGILVIGWKRSMNEDAC